MVCPYTNYTSLNRHGNEGTREEKREKRVGRGVKGGRRRLAEMLEGRRGLCILRERQLREREKGEKKKRKEGKAVERPPDKFIAGFTVLGFLKNL